MRFLLYALIAVIFAATSANAESIGQTIIHMDDLPSSKNIGDNFTGNVRVDPAFETKAPQRVYGAYVTFEPGARTKWHSHPLGQTLIVTSGAGLTQEWGKPVQVIRRGDIVLCPPNVKHWHGALPSKAMTHLAIGERADGKSVNWLESVSDEQYQAQENLIPQSKERP